MSWKHPQGVGIVLIKVGNIVLKHDLGISVNVIRLLERYHVAKIFRQMFPTKNCFQVTENVSNFCTLGFQ